MLTGQLMFYWANFFPLSSICPVSCLNIGLSEEITRTISIKVMVIPLDAAAVDIETQPSRSTPPVRSRWPTDPTANQTYRIPQVRAFERETSKRVAYEIATWKLLPGNVMFTSCCTALTFGPGKRMRALISLLVKLPYKLLYKNAGFKVCGNVYTEAQNPNTNADIFSHSFKNTHCLKNTSLVG